MLADTLTITYNAVSIALRRTTEANYQSSYYAENGGNKFTLEVKHTIPAKGAAGETHVVKLTVEYFDANGVYIGSQSAWEVIKAHDSSQNSVNALRVSQALVGLMTTTFTTDVVARQT